MFEEDFFNSKEEEEKGEERLLKWIDGNLKVVVGVSVLVGGMCIIIPICITLCWCISQKLEKRKSDNLEMTENKKEEEKNTEVDIEQNDEESPVYNDVSEDRPLPPVPATQQG